MREMEDLNEDLNGQQLDEGVDTTGVAEPEYGWDSEKNVLRYGDQEVDAKTFKGAWEDHVNKEKWQKSNTEERMKLKGLERDYAQYRQLHEVITKNPALYAEYDALFKKHMGAVGGQPVQQGGQNQFMQLDPATQDTLNTIQVKLQEQEIGSEMTQLKTRYGNLFKSDKDLELKVLTYAQEHPNIRSLVTCFHDLMFDAQQETLIREGMSRKNSARKNSLLLASAGAKGGPAMGVGKLDAKKLRGMSYNEIASYAEKELEGMSVGDEE